MSQTTPANLTMQYHNNLYKVYYQRLYMKLVEPLRTSLTAIIIGMAPYAFYAQQLSTNMAEVSFSKKYEEAREKIKNYDLSSRTNAFYFDAELYSMLTNHLTRAKHEGLIPLERRQKLLENTVDAINLSSISPTVSKEMLKISKASYDLQNTMDELRKRIINLADSIPKAIQTNFPPSQKKR